MLHGIRARRAAMVVLSLCAPGGVACGNGGGPATGAPPPAGGDGGAYDTPPVAAQLEPLEAPAAFAALMCEKIFGCCPPSDQARLPVASQEACASVFADLLRPTAMQIAGSITAGRVRYDGAMLGQCLRAYQSAGCAAATPMGTVISHRECAFLTPLVELGGACQQHFECKAGYCVMGACVSKKADGQSCGEDDECTGRCTPVVPRTCASGPPVDLCRAL